MSWIRMAGSLVLLYAVLALLLLLNGATALRSVREKQIKLEDIERDNLQTELLKQQTRPEQQQQQQQQHPAYQQAQQQQQQQQLQQEHEQAYQHYQPQQHPQHHFRYEQAPQHHHHHHHPHHQHQLLAQQQQQQQLLYQAAAAGAQAHPAQQGVVPTHIMYLIMPNGNVAAFQLAPHPNHLQQQAYYSPSAAKQQQQQQQLQQAMLGTLFHQHAAVQPMLQYYQPQYVASAAPAQRYQPAATVHHQPTLSFNSQQAHQLHAQHFRELNEQPAAVAAEYAAAAAAGPEQQQQQQHQLTQVQPQQAVQQSHKSLYGAGVKATASPPLKGSFSTQTGQSYANFRQYG